MEKSVITSIISCVNTPSKVESWEWLIITTSEANISHKVNIKSLPNLSSLSLWVKTNRSTCPEKISLISLIKPFLRQSKALPKYDMNSNDQPCRTQYLSSIANVENFPEKNYNYFLDYISKSINST